MNKRATLQATLFVIFTLVLVISVIFIFVSSYSKSNSKINSFDVYDKLYSEETNIKYFLKQIAEVSLIEAYKEVVDKGEYIAEPVKIDKSGNYFFERLNSNLNKIIEKEFNKTFRKNINLMEFNDKDENYMNNLKEVVNSGDYRVLFKDNKIFVFIDNLTLENSEKGVDVLYKPLINASADLSNLGLNNFNEIYNFKEKCAFKENFEDKKNCYLKNSDSLGEFNVSVDVLSDNPDIQRILVSLESKKDFLIISNNRGNFKKIYIKFIPN